MAPQHTKTNKCTLQLLLRLSSIREIRLIPYSPHMSRAPWSSLIIALSPAYHDHGHQKHHVVLFVVIVYLSTLLFIIILFFLNSSAYLPFLSTADSAAFHDVVLLLLLIHRHVCTLQTTSPIHSHIVHSPFRAGTFLISLLYVYTMYIVCAVSVRISITNCAYSVIDSALATGNCICATDCIWLLDWPKRWRSLGAVCPTGRTL